MADPYYYQDNNGQVFGPLTPSALKHLANEGVIHAATPVRKGEQGAWYQAGTIAGLVTPRPAQADAFATAEQDPAERARETFRKAEEHADKVAAKLWFLDLKFNHFFTPKLIGALWALLLCLIVIGFLVGLAHDLALLATNPLAALGGLIALPIGLVFSVLYGRVLLEALLVIFRIAEYLENLKHLENLKYLEPRDK